MIRSGTLISLRISFLVMVCIMLGTPLQVLCDDLKTQHLFKLGRSKNANIVQYDVHLTSEGTLYPKEPVIAYWIRLAEDGRRKELTSFQRRWYYGFKAKCDATSKCAIMELDRCKRKIKIYEAEGVYRGEVRIDGQPAFLEKIFVTSIKRGLFGKGYVELYGKDIRTGDALYEKIGP